MRGGNKLWSTIVDYFLILSAIIGVGFASGKEIYVFFFDFGGASILGLISFGLLYIYLFLVIQYISNKLKINTYSEFNQKIFGKLCKFTNIILLINFTITSSGMLAGADYLFETFFGIRFGIPSLILSIIAFVILLGGVKRIKAIANLIVPIMIFVIVINSIKNITPSNVHLEIIDKNIFMAIYYGLLFGVNNFVTAMPMLFQTKLRSRGKLISILTICIIILLNILVLAGGGFSSEMPMFELSQNVSIWFYYIYFATLILALTSTLIISSFNAREILSKGKSGKFVQAVVVLVNLIISKLGYSLIVKYLYVVSGIISGVYVLAMIIFIIIKLSIRHQE
ncbi:MAG: hypothetical protein ACLRFL_00765, partial [Clostridia bacterium]